MELQEKIYTTQGVEHHCGIEQSSSSKDKYEKGFVCDQNKQIRDLFVIKTTLSSFMDKPFEITETVVTSKATKTHVTIDRSIEVSAVIGYLSSYQGLFGIYTATFMI